MSKVSRNDPCPCGSGRKYKKCCLLSEESSDFQYRLVRHAHSALIPKLTEFALEHFGEVLEDAWNEFNDEQEVESFTPDGPLNVVFMPWFLFNWVLELKPPGKEKFIETTIAELFLTQELQSLGEHEKELLISSIRCPYSFCEVTEINAGVGMTLFDLLRRIKYDVNERSASQTLKRGEIIYCATAEIEGVKSNVGTGPYALRPTAKRDVLELRKWMIEQIEEDQISATHLRKFEDDIRGLYLSLMRGMLAPPRLANTDGDPMVPQKLVYEIDSPDEAFHALKSLAEGWDTAELLKRAELEDGLVVKAELDWLGGKPQARKRLAGSVLLGFLKIDRKRLIIEVNSHQRAERIQKLVAGLLGNSARYKTTLIEPIESQVQKAWQAAAAGETDRTSITGINTSGNSARLEDLPEVRAMLKEIARQHWQAWFDLPVPALNDMTPREAAKTEEGRDLLESLLLLYESHAQKSEDDPFEPDIPALRRDLGMD